MAVSLQALKDAITAGIVQYNTHEMGFQTGGSGAWGGEQVGPVYSKLIVQVFGSDITVAQNLHEGPALASTVFSAAYNDSQPLGVENAVKSYLSAPVVCPIKTTGTVTKIAFALVHEYTGNDDPVGAVLPKTLTETYHNGVIESGLNSFVHANNISDVPASTPIVVDGQSSVNYGDVFMVITLDSGVSVTAGGYLTVKGYDGSTEPSKNHTYVRIESSHSY